MTTTDELIGDQQGGTAVHLHEAGQDGLRAEVELSSPDGTTQTLAISSPALTSVTLLPATQPGVVVDLLITATATTADQPVRLTCRWPSRGAVTLWRPDGLQRRDVPPDWGSHRPVRSTRSAPVASLVGADDSNIFTAALSSAVRSCEFALGLSEEEADAVLAVTVTEVEPAEEAIQFGCRIDVRSLHFATVLREVTGTWQAELADRVTPVPELAYQTMYSTWYSDHQNVSADLIERRARAGEAYGCQAIIVDDGWQTDDNRRGYAYCGDWEPAPAFPDMAAHVQRVREIGLGYLLWIAPGLIGPESRAWKTLGTRHCCSSTAWTRRCWIRAIRRCVSTSSSAVSARSVTGVSTG